MCVERVHCWKIVQMELILSNISPNSEATKMSPEVQGGRQNSNSELYIFSWMKFFFSRIYYYYQSFNQVSVQYVFNFFSQKHVHPTSSPAPPESSYKSKYSTLSERRKVFLEKFVKITELLNTKKIIWFTSLYERDGPRDFLTSFIFKHLLQVSKDIPRSYLSRIWEITQI